MRSCKDMDVRFFPSEPSAGAVPGSCTDAHAAAAAHGKPAREQLSREITDEVSFFADYRQFVREVPEDIPMENLQTTVGTENENGS